MQLVVVVDLLCVICAYLAACEIWRRQEGVASSNGVLYPYTSLSKCLKMCLESFTCLTRFFGLHFRRRIRRKQQVNGHYAVQGRSRSPILVPIESPYATSY